MISQQERVTRMKDAYMQLHAQGLTPKQIAYRFDLASSSVYNALQEIADANGVSRESLLQIPRSPHVTHERRFEPVLPVDLTDFQARFQIANADLVRVIESCVATIGESERNADLFEREELEWQSSR